MPAFPKAAQTTSTKPKKVKSKAKKERDALENKLDALVSRICRQQGYCTTCKKSNCVLNAHHFRSRKYKGVRWYLPNLICLCVHCHTFSFYFSAHKTPEAFKMRMLELKGVDWLNDIDERQIAHTSWKLNELQVLYEELKKLDILEEKDYTYDS